MQSAAAAREKLAYAVVGIDRFEQFDLALAGEQQRRTHPLVLDSCNFGERQPEYIAPERHRLVEIRHDYANMMNLLEHRQPSVELGQSLCCSSPHCAFI